MGEEELNEQFEELRREGIHCRIEKDKVVCETETLDKRIAIYPIEEFNADIVRRRLKLP